MPTQKKYFNYLCLICIGCALGAPSARAQDDPAKTLTAYTHLLEGERLRATDPTAALLRAAQGWRLLPDDPHTQRVVHDLYVGEPLYEARFKVEGKVSDMAWSPDRDAVALAIEAEGKGRNEVQLRDMSGRPIGILPHDDRVNAVAWSPDGLMVATASEDTIARVWRRDGTLVATYKEHGAHVNDITWTPDNAHVLSAGCDRTARLWDLSGKTTRVFSGHDGEVYAVAISDDGQHLLTGTGGWISEVDGDNTARLWSIDGTLLHTDKLSTSSYSTNQPPHALVAFRPGTHQWFTSFFAKAHLYEDAIQVGALNTEDPITRKSLYWRANPPFLTNGRVAIPYPEHDIALIDPLAKEPPILLKGHHAVVKRIEASSLQLLSLDTDGWVYLWNLDKEPLHRFETQRSSVNLTPSADGQWLLVPSSLDYGGELWLLPPGGGAPILHATLRTQSHSAASGQFSPDSATVYLADETVIKRWDLDGALLWESAFSHNGGTIHAIAISADGHTGASAAYDNVKLWDAHTGALLKVFDLPADWDNALSLDFSPDGALLVAGYGGGLARLWSISTGNVQLAWRAAEKATNRGVSAVAFSPDGKTIATSDFSADEAHLWGLSGELLVSFPHRSSLSALAFAPDGGWLMTAGWDREVILWSLQGFPFQVIQHPGAVTAAVPSADGLTIFSKTNERQAYQWRRRPTLAEFLATSPPKTP